MWWLEGRTSPGQQGVALRKEGSSNPDLFRLSPCSPHSGGAEKITAIVISETAFASISTLVDLILLFAEILKMLLKAVERFPYFSPVFAADRFCDPPC